MVRPIPRVRLFISMNGRSFLIVLQCVPENKGFVRKRWYSGFLRGVFATHSPPCNRPFSFGNLRLFCTTPSSVFGSLCTIVGHWPRFASASVSRGRSRPVTRGEPITLAPQTTRTRGRDVHQARRLGRCPRHTRAPRALQGTETILAQNSLSPSSADARTVCSTRAARACAKKGTYIRAPPSG